jgi:hypothetical protein
MRMTRSPNESKPCARSSTKTANETSDNSARRSTRLLIAVRRNLGPVLLAIDDADLVDDATLTTLEYVYHRIDDQQIWLSSTSPPRRPGAGPLAIEHLLVNQHVRHFTLKSRSASRACASSSPRNSSVEPEPEFVAAVLRRDERTPGVRRRDGQGLCARSASRRTRVGRQRPRSTGGPADLPEGPGATEPTGTLRARPPRTCAIYGELSDVASVIHLAGIEPDASDHAVDSLVHAELLRPGRPLTFVAPVVQWAILQDIPHVASFAAARALRRLPGADRCRRVARRRTCSRRSRPEQGRRDED